MGEERRKSIRARERLVAFIKSPTSGRVRRALTKDISPGGLCVVTEEPLEEGVQLELEFKLPDQVAPIVCTGQVAWSRTAEEVIAKGQAPVTETGIKFVRIEPKALSLIRQHVAMNAPPPEPR